MNERIALSEPAVMLILQSSDFQKISNPVVKTSIGYWVSRHRIQTNQTVDSQWVAWRQGQDCNDSARVGVVILAEDYLLDGRNVLLETNHPAMSRLAKFSYTAIESSLSVSPQDWWPGVLSDKLTNSCNLIIVFLVTITNSSISFIVSTALPRLSQLLSNPDLNDWDLSWFVTNVMKMVKKYPRQQVSQNLAKLKFSLHKDLKALLNSYC